MLFSVPRKLYKYLPPDGAEKLFAQPSLWFRFSNKFNDVFDLRPAGSHPTDGFGAIPVLCLCETSTSPPMWAHYGNKGEGIVLEFDTESDFFKRYEPHKVRYRTKRPTIKKLQDAALVKSQEWAYEREWRCFANAPPHLASDEKFLDSPQAVSVPFPFDALSAVIHGHDGRTVIEAGKFLENSLASHVKHLVCRIDAWKFAFNLCTLDDISHIHENQEAAMWGRRQR